MSADAVARAETDATAGPSAAAMTGGLLGRQIVQYAPGVLAPAVVALVFAMVFTRIFTVAEYGRVSLAQSAATVAILFLSQWLQQGTNRFLPGAPPGEKTTRLKAAIGLGLLCVGIAAASAALAAVVLGPLILPVQWRHLTWSGAAAIVASVLYLPLGVVLQSEMRARRFSAYSLVASAARLALALGLVAIVAREPAAMLWSQAAAFAMLVPVLWRDVGLPSVSSLLRQRRALWPDVRRLAMYGTPMIGWMVVANLLDASDRWIIQYFRGPSEVGIYAANYGLVANTVGLIAMPMIVAVHPFLMRAWSTGERAAAGRWLGVIVEWYLVTGALLVGVVSLFSHDIAALLLGPSFREGHRIIPVVVAGMVAWQLGMYAHKPLEFAERTTLMFGLCSLTAVFNGAMNLLLVPRYGYMAAAYTSLASYALYLLLTVWLGRRLLVWTLDWSGLGKLIAVGASGCALALVVRIGASSIAGNVAGFAAAGLVTLLTCSWILARQLRPVVDRLRGSPLEEPTRDCRRLC